MLTNAEWHDVCDGIRQRAEEYASLDPPRASNYRDEADELAKHQRPSDLLAYLTLQEKADALFLYWALRVAARRP